MKNKIIPIVISVLFALLLWYFMLPPLNPTSPTFWVYLFTVAIFTRSFKNEFGITPSKLKKEKDNKYKIFPRLKFGSQFNNKKIINYVIKRINGFTIYGKKVSAINFDDLHFKIRELYKEIKRDGTYDLFNENGRYALTYDSNYVHIYLVGSTLKNMNLDIYNVKKGEYAIFEVGNKTQKDIIKTIEFINEIWYYSSKLGVKDDPYIECYTKDNCFIYVPLDKRNKTDM